MKALPHYASRITCLLILTLLTLGASCPKNPDGTPSYVQEARDLGEFGTLAALLDNPDHRTELVLTTQALRDLEAIAGPVNLEMLQQVLQRLPVEKLQTPKARLYVLAGKMFLRRVGGDSQLGDISDVKPIARALREGMEAALQ